MDLVFLRISSEGVDFGRATSLNLRGGQLRAFERLISLYLSPPYDIMICNKLGAVLPVAAGAFLFWQTKCCRDLLNIQLLEITQIVQSLLFSACPFNKCKYGLSSTNDYHHKNRIQILSINTVSAAPHLFPGPSFFGHFWNHKTMALLVGPVGESIRMGNKKDVQAYNRSGGSVTVYQGGLLL